MKTKEELASLKEEVETLNKKLSELTEDELREVAGGLPSFQYGNLFIGSAPSREKDLLHYVDEDVPRFKSGS